MLVVVSLSVVVVLWTLRRSETILRNWAEGNGFQIMASEVNVGDLNGLPLLTMRDVALRGWRVTVIDKGGVANAGSGNPAAVVYGRLAAPGKALDHFPQAAWLFMLRELSTRRPAEPAWHPCGILQLATGNLAAQADAVRDDVIPREFARRVGPEEASTLAGVPIAYPAVYFPLAGWLDAQRYCRSLLEHPLIEVRTGMEVTSLNPNDGEWAVGLSGGAALHAPVVVLATAGAVPPLDALTDLPLSSIRGQVSLAPSTRNSEALRRVVCHDGYISPALPDAGHCLGATFHPGDTDTTVRAEDHLANRQLLAQALPELAASLSPEAGWAGRAALRCQRKLDELNTTFEQFKREPSLIEGHVLRFRAATGGRCP